MADTEKKQEELPDREKIREQLTLLKPRAQRAAATVFRIASSGVNDLKADKETAGKLKKSGELIVWLELIAFIIYLFDRVASSRMKDSRHMYMDLLMNSVISTFPEEVDKYGRKDLRSEQGWEQDVVGTVSARSLQYFSLEQEVCGGTGSVESLPPEGLFWEFGGIIAHQMGAPEDKAVTEVVSLRARSGLNEILRELGPGPEESVTQKPL